MLIFGLISIAHGLGVAYDIKDSGLKDFQPLYSTETSSERSTLPTAKPLARDVMKHISSEAVDRESFIAQLRQVRKVGEVKLFQFFKTM
jgi:hypothetical protein